jgi:hypothetical protein
MMLGSGSGCGTEPVGNEKQALKHFAFENLNSEA